MSAPGDGGSREAPPDRGATAAAHADTVFRRLRVRVPLMALAMLALLSALAGDWRVSDGRCPSPLLSWPSTAR